MFQFGDGDKRIKENSDFMFSNNRTLLFLFIFNFILFLNFT